MFYRVLQYTVFPAIMVLALAGTYVFYHQWDWSLYVAVYPVIVVSALVIAGLERAMPYRAAWNQADQDVLTDTLHGVVDYLLIPFLQKPVMIWVLLFVTTSLSDALGVGLWPHEWPLVLQLALALLVSDAGRYWGHRLAHEVPFLWRLHEVHHSPRRLYWWNAVRQHPLDRIWFYFTEVFFLVLLGAPEPVIALYLVFNAIHGFFQHTNIDIKLGPLSWVVNVADLHRWHHSKKISESNANYGNNLIVFDVLFGTRKQPAGAVADIGVSDPDYPQSYWAQLWYPFRSIPNNDHQPVSHKPSSDTER